MSNAMFDAVFDAMFARVLDGMVDESSDRMFGTVAAQIAACCEAFLARFFDDLLLPHAHGREVSDVGVADTKELTAADPPLLSFMCFAVVCDMVRPGIFAVARAGPLSSSEMLRRCVFISAAPAFDGTTKLSCVQNSCFGGRCCFSFATVSL